MEQRVQGTFKQTFRQVIYQIKTFKVVILTTILAFTFCSLFITPSSVYAQLDALNNHPLYYASSLRHGNNNTYYLYKESPPKLNTKSLKSIENRLKFFFPFESETEIENNIWQLWKYRADSDFFPTKCFQHMERWRVVNSEYNHNLITFDEAEQQILHHFSYDIPEVIDAYMQLPDIRLKFDFLKYLIIFVSGGVYADIDTLDAKPLKYWHKSNLKQEQMIVGINVDYNDVNWDNLYNRRLTFSTKIFEAKSHHPFLAKLIARIVYMSFNSKDEINSIDWNKTYQNVDSNDEPLIQFTSESIFTDTLFEYFNELDNPIVHRVARTEKDLIPEMIFGPETNQIFSYKLFTLAKGPTQVDDIVVLPQISFKGPLSGFHKGDYVEDYEKEYDDNPDGGFYYARSLHFLNWDSLIQDI
jgi:mannosyltransferase OCH1-like enzyme